MSHRCRAAAAPRLAAVLLAAVLLLAGPAAACTTFCYADGDRVLFGRNYDFEHGHGLVFVNPRGLGKRSSISRPPQAEWVARFGSLTFNQMGRDQPMGGINERGLVVELMWLDGTRYPAPDARPALGLLEWIQHALDRYDTVAALLAGVEQVRIAPSRIPIHFLVADRTGDVATIEFLDGALVAHRGETLPARALANHSYADSLAYLKRLAQPDAPRPAFTSGSLARFAEAARQVEAHAAQPTASAAEAVARAFATLDAVKQPSYTRWQIVYDLQAMRVHWRSDENAAVRTLDVGALDYACGPARLLPLHGGAGAMDGALQPYSTEANFALIRTSVRATSFLKGTAESALVDLARWPERTSACR